MKRKYKKFLVVSTIFIALGGVYLYFAEEVKSEKVVSVAYGSSLVSSTTNGEDASALSFLGDKLNSDVSFLSSLVSLKKITIDTTLFTNKSFTSLKNNTVKLDPVSPGRQNPFSPIGSDGLSSVYSSTSKVVTEKAVQITGTSATFNGLVNVTDGVTDTYFRYGNTKDVSITTAIVKQSLIGAFIKNVSGLTPKTTYFYKACARINNAETCGEIETFTTTN